MTPTNTKELQELTELRKWVKELEETVEESCWTYNYPSGHYYCEHCLAWDNDARWHGNDEHKPDCIVTKIKNRRGE